MVICLILIVIKEKNQLQAAKLPLDVICNKYQQSGSHLGRMEVNDVLPYTVPFSTAALHESYWKSAPVQLPFCKLLGPSVPQIQRSGDLT